MVNEIAPTKPVISIDAILAASFFFLSEEVMGSNIMPNPTSNMGTNSQNDVILESKPVSTNNDMIISRQA